MLSLRNKVGLGTPFAIYSSMWALKSLSASLTSQTSDSAIWINNGASSKRAVSSLSVNQDFMKIPFSGYSWKFSAILSTIIIFEMFLPILDKSFT
jgi:hypothetical protein